MTSNSPLKILITGGAGFIGSHLARKLVQRGHRVRLLDLLTPQIHGTDATFPADLLQVAECVVGNVTDSALIADCVQDVDTIVHLAAETGMGQSQSAIRRYYDTNVTGTATLLDALANCQHQVKRVIVASTARVYGEGPYLCEQHGRFLPAARSAKQMAAHRWEICCPHCGMVAASTLCREDDPIAPTSFYAATKESQERMLHLFGQLYAVETVVLRYQNVYGAGQSLRNPYTGVLIAFCNQLRQGLPPRLFEDGLCTRDFVHVNDVVDATCRALETKGLNQEIINIGGGSRATLREVASEMTRAFGHTTPPQVTCIYRQGDIRHMQADISRAQQRLGYAPRVALSTGIRRLATWAQTHPLPDSQLA